MISERRKYSYLQPSNPQPQNYNTRAHRGQSKQNAGLKSGSVRKYDINNFGNIRCEAFGTQLSSGRKPTMEIRTENEKQGKNPIQKINQNLLDDMSKQFMKFEKDLVRVESILKAKQELVAKLEEEKGALKEQNDALSKQLKRKQEKVMELEQREKIAESKSFAKSQQQNLIKNQQQLKIALFEQELRKSQQRIKQLEEELEKERRKCGEQEKKSQALSQQVYKLKEQLYQSSSQLNITKQQFETYKLLKEIENVKNL